MEREIKQSFTPKYILLTIFVSLISAFLGFSSNYVFKKVFDKQNMIKVTTEASNNLIVSVKLLDELGFNVNCIPIENPNTVVKCCFRISVKIANEGDEGIEK